MPGNIAGSTAVVTGGASGPGRTTADRIVARGGQAAIREREGDLPRLAGASSPALVHAAGISVSSTSNLTLTWRSFRTTATTFRTFGSK